MQIDGASFFPSNPNVLSVSSASDSPRVDEEDNDDLDENSKKDASEQESTRPANPPSQLTDNQLREIFKLKARDQEVRAHETAHKSAAGGLAGAASFSYTKGPDGRQYASGGEVSINTSEVAGDPQATASKAATIRRAALAPSNPSSQDLRVAASANRMLFEAQRELVQLQVSEGNDSKQGSLSATNNENDKSVGSEERNYGDVSVFA